jgi:hypothetical protein
MPSSTEVLDALTALANRFWYLAAAWHVATAVGIVAVLAGFHPSRRLAGVLLVTPCLSVAGLALSVGNPFNGLVFLATAFVLFGIAIRLPSVPVRRSAHWAATHVGLALLTFGWMYPHFLVGASPFAYLYAAPMGVVPCPTLAAIIGVSLLAGGFQSRSWSWVLASVGLFYGAFGVLRLGVTIDWMLGLGALVLAALPLNVRRTPPTLKERAVFDRAARAVR